MTTDEVAELDKRFHLDSAFQEAVIPCLRQGLRSTLKEDAARHDVTVDKLFSKQIFSDGIESSSKELTPTKETKKKGSQDDEKQTKKGFIAWLTRVFQR